MDHRFVAMVLLLGLLSACTISRDELLARDRQDCATFGFQPGTRDYAECLLRLDAARQTSYGHHYGGRY